MKKIFLFFLLLCTLAAIYSVDAPDNTLTSAYAAEKNITADSQSGKVTSLDSLTTASTSSDTVRLYSNMQSRFNVMTFSITVSGINADSTYQNMVIRIVGGQSKIKMGNLRSDGTDITLTANGVYNFIYSYAGTTDYFAVLLISKAGGTPKIHISAKAG